MKRSSPAEEQPQDGTVSPPPSKRMKNKVASTTTKSAVNSFFTPISQKGPEKLAWRIVNGSLLVGRYNATIPPASNETTKCKRVKIAAFDFDSTLIATSTGAVFGRSPTDWRWWHSSVPSRLQSLHADGYTLAIISNQGGLNLAGKEQTAAKAKRLAEFKEKAGYALGQLDLPISLYAATAKDGYRKPRAGMWWEMLRDLGLDGEEGERRVDLEGSVFVGDAAGRLARKGGKVKADHSCSDRDFAANTGIGFKTPEEFFLGEEPVPWERKFDPKEYVKETVHVENAMCDATSNFAFEKKDELDIVLLVGSPGSGKSTFYWTFLEPLGYTRANQDILKTRDKCLKHAREVLEEDKKPVAVDNTNADEKTRADWIALAREVNVPIRCVWLDVPAEVCKHNEAVRALHGEEKHRALDLNPEKRTSLPSMAFQGYWSRFREPTAAEGFSDVLRVPFAFRGTEDQRTIWAKYWT